MKNRMRYKERKKQMLLNYERKLVKYHTNKATKTHPLTFRPRIVAHYPSLTFTKPLKEKLQNLNIPTRTSLM